MRIAVFDTNGRKFTRDIMEHWRAQGHEVSFLHAFHLPHAEAADVLWFDCVDGNLRTATKDHAKVLQGKKVIARAIDIDIWANHFPGIDWSKVNHLIFIARHIQKYMLGQITLPDSVKVRFVPCGVNLKRFTMRKDPTPNHNVAFVANLWHGKGLALLLQMIAALPDYTFHICGRWGMSSLEARWHRRYIDQFLEKRTNWTYVDHVPDMNEWLEDKAFILSCSFKESFGYAIGEGMAKGLKPVIHNFYGAQIVWPEHHRWDTISEAVKIITEGPYSPNVYRKHIEDRYSLTRMMQNFDSLLGGRNGNL